MTTPIQFTPDELLHFVRWTNALMSGEYRQAFGRAYDNTNDSHCGLGVGYSLEGVGFFEDGNVSHADANGLTGQCQMKLMLAGLLAVVTLNDCVQLSLPEIGAEMLRVYREHNADIDSVPALAFVRPLGVPQ